MATPPNSLFPIPLHRFQAGQIPDFNGLTGINTVSGCNSNKDSHGTIAAVSGLPVRIFPIRIENVFPEPDIPTSVTFSSIRNFFDLSFAKISRQLQLIIFG